MNKKRKKEEKKKPRLKFKKDEFRKSLRDFLGGKLKKELETIQKRYDKKENVWVGDIERYSFFGEHVRESRRNDCLRVFRDHHGLRPKILRPKDIRRILSRQGVKTLRTFFSSFFHMETQLSRVPLVDQLMDCYEGITPSIFKRKVEMKNIDESYISNATSFFLLSQITVPKDIMLEIFKYFHYNLDLLETVGSVNSSFYLLILTTWSSWVPISHSTLYQISTLVLKSMRKFYLGAGLGKEEYNYLLDIISPSRIEEIDFHYRCKATEIRSFFTILASKKKVFSSCHTLHFPELTKKATRRGRGCNSNFIVPPENFPSLTLVDHLQPMDSLFLFTDLSRNKNIKQLVFGCKMFPVTKTKIPIFHPRDETRRTSFRTVDGFHFPTQQFSRSVFGNGVSSFRRFDIIKNKVSSQFSSKLPDGGENITSLKFRIKSLFTDYHTFCRVISCPMKWTIHKLELIVDRLYLPGEKIPYPYLPIDSRNYQLTLDGKICAPESEFIFSQLDQLKELKIQQKRIGQAGFFGATEDDPNQMNHLVGLFGPRSRFKKQNYPSLKIAKFTNVPISICDSALEKFTNLEIFHIVFVCGDISRHVCHFPINELLLFFNKFVDAELNERKFQWDEYFFYEESGNEIQWRSESKNPYGYEKPGDYAKKRNHKVKGWDGAMKVFLFVVKQKLLGKKKEYSKSNKTSLIQQMKD